jgi:CheY-like chemotaxis protein
MTGSEPLRGKHILVVEDEFMLADDLKKTLQGLGAIVIGPAPSVTSAQVLVENTVAIDAAVLDVNLRDVMSYTVADALQKQGVPFLFTTGYDKLAIPQHYVGVPRVHKPYGQEEVVERLLKLLSASTA